MEHFKLILVHNLHNDLFIKLLICYCY